MIEQSNTAGISKPEVLLTGSALNSDSASLASTEGNKIDDKFIAIEQTKIVKRGQDKTDELIKAVMALTERLGKGLLMNAVGQRPDAINRSPKVNDRTAAPKPTSLLSSILGTGNTENTDVTRVQESPNFAGIAKTVGRGISDFIAPGLLGSIMGGNRTPPELAALENFDREQPVNSSTTVNNIDRTLAAGQSDIVNTVRPTAQSAPSSDSLERILAAAIETNNNLVEQNLTLEKIREAIQKTIPTEEEILESKIQTNNTTIQARALEDNKIPEPEQPAGNGIMDMLMEKFGGGPESRRRPRPAPGGRPGIGNRIGGAARGLMSRLPAALGTVAKIAAPVAGAIALGGGIMEEGDGKKIESATDIIPEGFNKLNPFAYAMNAGRLAGNKINQGVESISGGASLGSLISDGVGKLTGREEKQKQAETEAEKASVRQLLDRKVGNKEPISKFLVDKAKQHSIKIPPEAIMATVISAQKIEPMVVPPEAVIPTSTVAEKILPTVVNSPEQKLEPTKTPMDMNAAKTLNEDSVKVSNAAIASTISSPTVVNSPSTVNNNTTIIKDRKSVRNTEPTYLSNLRRNIINGTT